MKVLAVLLLTGLMLQGCNDNPVEPNTATDATTNKWIYSQMSYWYYWKDDMPKTPDTSLAPDAFFNSLLYKYDAVARPNGDRFSWIQRSAEELSAGLSGKETSSGMEFRLLRYPLGTSNIIGVVIYVLPGSPAEKAGFKRGDIFTGINAQQLNESNYQSLVAARGALSFAMASVDSKGEVVTTNIKRAVSTEEIQADPVFYDTTFQYGANKIGYLVYHQFVPAPYKSENHEYDKELEEVIGSFKDKGVNSVILDLRYNPGGYVSSATALASLLGKVTSNDVFYYKEYNKTATTDLKERYGETYFYEKFASKSQNIGSQLKNLIVLTSGRTASASELLINGLKPFMPVTVIGAKTVGKNVGSITITSQDKSIKWGLQPIVTKSSNSLHKSDYSTGFVPDVESGEGMVLYPFGDVRDPLLGDALFYITGTRVVRKAAGASLRVLSSQEIMSTVDMKAGRGNMFFDK